MSNVNSQRSSFGFLVAGAIALVIIAVGLFYWFFAKKPVNLASSISQPQAAIFVSKVAPVMVSLLNNPVLLWENQKELSQLKTSLLAETDLDYKQDIKPWLGKEITLAVTSTDIDRDPENGEQPGYLMALATKKPEISREFVELLFSRRVLAGANLEVEKYAGVKLLSDSGYQLHTSLSAAVVGDFVLFANHPKVLRDAINNVQAPDVNLSSSSQYQRALQQLPKSSVAVAFVNLPAVAAWQGLELPTVTFDSQFICLSLHPQGLLAESNFLTNSEIIPVSPPLSQNVGALAYIPQGAGLVVSGTHLNNLPNSDLGQLWKQASGSGTDAISSWLKPWENLGVKTQEIFSWVKGEYALAVLPHPGRGVDWVFVVEKLEDVPGGIARLDSIAAADGLSVSSFNWNQNTVFAWTELTAAQTHTLERPSFNIEAEVRGVHTNVGNYEIFASSWETLAPLITNQNSPIVGDRYFQDSINALPQPNQGYVYLDWTQSRTLLERQLPTLQLVEIVGQSFWQKLRSLTISSYSQEKGLLKTGVLLRFLD
ncbi:DUF3352 domain-containing protein [Anabaenopsis elenkinii]|uniref:DUF3352 domain-containing protein n=1 Tax=Anabaenopsis elenkinii CCIBt3563 TaxID=2779889 RepID=A0A7U3NKY2_9CYAN|nr:DUF3352 domain-containing protein [Anabaenopsis elenkinii]QOV21141.1 DUF3352 domain-containing protein [Anabaenopsis elenkinii CCIBt3563]QOV21148.1 DUF3352 domain-containing protein [Anabaenopsis elenkinii CCIBt3563]